MSNNSIIQKAALGDRKSLRALYDEHVDTMFASSYRITNDLQASEDIIQDSFLTSFAKLDTLSEENNYQGWLRRIVINNSLGYLRKKKTFSEIESNHTEFIEVEKEENWYAEITWDEIRDAIQELPNSARAIFSLYALEGYKHREIAELQSISVGTSKSQYQYAKKLLQELLTKKVKDEI